MTEEALPAADASPEEWAKLRDRLKRELEEKRNRNKLGFYRPYGKQVEFHTAGSLPIYERLFMAGNQLGKTWAGGFEMAMHLTGRYPDWWQGRRWDRPVTALAGSESAELTRDGVQRVLVGSPANEEDWGTGCIPADMLKEWKRKQGVPDALDSIQVKHVNGGMSTLLFKSYDQRRTKWQANTVDVVWFDEEPPEDVYSEGRTRTNATKGSVFLTFTPLKGMSKVVRRFLTEKSPHRHVTAMTIHDAEHYTDEERQRIIDSYEEHERDARASGIPILGSGRVFPLPDKALLCDPIPIPDWWPRLGGLDFGWDHPTAAVELVWDRDHDVVYVVREHRASKMTPEQHSLVVGPRKWGEIKWAWPHDGLQHDKGSGDQLAKSYKKTGMKMLGAHATFSDGTFGVEAGVLEMLQRMRDGRWKVFTTCPLWMEEFRLYHRDEGKIVKEMDDLLSASRYAMMMLRYARILEAPAGRYGFDARKDTAVAVGTGEGPW